MNIKHSLKLIVIISIILFGCKKPPLTSDKQLKNILFSLKTSECMGSCPVFTFTIFPDGNCTYKGIANVDNIGTFYGAMNEEEMKKFKLTLSTSDFYNITFESNSLVKDLPTTYLFYNDGAQQKTITYYNASNKKIEDIITKANGLIAITKWIKD